MQLFDRFVRRLASDAEFFDPAGGKGHDGVLGVVVLLKAQALPVQRAVDVGALVLEPFKLAAMLAPFGGVGLGQLVTQQVQPIGAKESPGEEIHQVFEDYRFLDPQDLWMACCVGGGEAAAGDELAAVPVRALLMAAFHPASAQAAANSSAQRVGAAAAGRLSRGVVGSWLLCGDLVSSRALLDGVEQLLGHDRFMDGGWTPHPLLSRALVGTSAALVVAAPHVVAGVLGVAQHRVKLRSAPRLAQRHLVFAVALRGWVAVEVAVEALADFAEAEAAQAVPREDRQDDRCADGVGDEAVLALSFARLLGVGVGVFLEHVAVGHPAAGVPALAHALLHPPAALFDEVAHVPLGYALLDAAREDGGGVGDHRLVGGEQRNV